VESILTIIVSIIGGALTSYVAIKVQLAVMDVRVTTLEDKDEIKEKERAEIFNQLAKIREDIGKIKGMLEERRYGN